MVKINIQLPARFCAFVIAAATFAQGPGAMPRPTPPNPTRDSTNNPRTEDTSGAAESIARGQVVLASGAAPTSLVAIAAACGGAEKFLAVADAKGRFSFNPAALGDAQANKGCVLRASLEGYRSDTRPLSEVKQNSSTKLGKLVLTPVSSDTTGLASSTAAEAGKAAKKAYDKGLDDAAKQAWPEAKTSFLKATAAYPGYSDAWLSLGILQQSQGDRDGAQKSFAEAARADAKFAVPLVLTASLDAVRGDWQASLDHSQKAIDMNPQAFPHAYEVNALANLNLQKIDAAEKSAAEGLKLDTEHRYPELEYLLGLALSTRRDIEGATRHLQAYIDQSPDGPNVARAKTALTQMRAGK